jgi:hypothetical protein
MSLETLSDFNDLREWNQLSAIGFRRSAIGWQMYSSQ